MINNSQKQRTVFSDDANLTKIIFDILTKYRLGETIQQIHEKIKKGEIPNTIILSKITLDVTAGKISMNDLVSLLQKQLGIQKETAGKLAEDIKLQLIPLTTKVFIDEDIELEQGETMPIEPIKPPIGIPNIGNLVKTQTKPPNEDIIANKFEKSKKSFKERKIKEIEKPSTKLSKKQQDTYREPIE